MLEAISFTNNGKSATPAKQAEILNLVGDLETSFPPNEKILMDPKEAGILDGTWFLQYTSSSTAGEADRFPNAWKPRNIDQGPEANIESVPFNAKGSVSAAGINVDTSNRTVKQIIDATNSRVTNDVMLDWGRVCVSGRFRPSPSVPTRALVAFDTCKIKLGTDTSNGPTINLSFLFKILAIVRQTEDNGWLETTFVDDDVRIGRGNKGTMFVLTRDPNAVKP